MKFFFCLFLQMILASGEQVNQTIPLPEQDVYKLIWSDEFNTDGPPDSIKWKFEAGFTRNEEAQRYQQENAVCENGHLVIIGKKEHKPNPKYVAGSANSKKNREFIDYTSASLVM